MGFWSRRSELLDGPAELADIEPALQAAAERFGRDLAKHASRRAIGPRVGRAPTRLPAMQLGRPVRMPMLLPQRPRNVMPPTILEERSPLADAVEDNADRVEGVIRRRLLELRRALEHRLWRLGGSSR